MEKSEREIIDTFRETTWLDDTESKTSILEGLLAQAEAKNLDSLAFEIRLEMVQSTVFSGDIQRALVAFTHCVAEFDAEKDYAMENAFSVLWSSKWINRTVIAFPTISKQQINDIEQDIADRFEKHGFGLRAHYMFGWVNAIEMGDKAKADSLRKKWLSAAALPDHPRCEACELHYEMHYHFEEKNIEKGLHAYRVLLRSNESCNRVPIASHIKALPHLESNTDQQRAALLFTDFELDPPSMDQVALAGGYLLYLLSIDEQTKGLKILNGYLPKAMKTKELDQKLCFLAAAECFLHVYPTTHVLQQYSNPEFLTILKTEIDKLALAFDERNRNSLVSDDISEKRALYSVE